MSRTPQTIGSYRILEPLGAGGMGVVYRAIHLQTGQMAALKTVKVPQGWMLQAIRREIRALARIRHPGIVHILEEGVYDGLPWYAMALVDGIHLQAFGALDPQASDKTEATRQVTARTAATVDPDTPSVQQAASAVTVGPDAEHRGVFSTHSPLRGMPLLQILGVIRRLCSALAFLHGEGIVHRDLKPGNILVTPEGWPVIVDFGLMAQFGGEQSREALAIAGEMVGTAAYMAPEQILGDFVDARADLYALGCILYELVTGRPPFRASSRAELGHAHLHSEPVPPSVLVRGLPPQLEALILRLLAKHPRWRLGHANDVAAILTELGAPEGVQPICPAPRAYLYRPGLAGRRDVLERFDQAVDALESGQGSLNLIGGESGSGKTRLVMEIARKARLRRLAVLAGEAEPGPDPEALGALRQPLQAVADRCREEGPEAAQRLLGPRAAILAPYLPELSAIPGLEAFPAPEALPAAAARLRLYTALSETFVAFTLKAPIPPRPEAASESPAGQLTRVPLLLVLDDLQWADELTLGWLEFLARSQQDRPVAVLATYRLEDLSANPALQRLLAGPKPDRTTLTRLDHSAVGNMVGDMLAMVPAPALFVRFLTEHSEGNPFFVAEYLRAAVGEGLLFRDPQGRWQVIDPLETRRNSETPYDDLPLPRSLRELVGRRLQGLPRQTQLLVEAAAVAGREADVLLAWSVSQLSDEDLLDALDTLVRRQVLETSAPGRLRFLHDKIREVALEAMPPQRRTQLHRQVAEVLELHPPAEQAEHYSALATHWAEAGFPEKAAPFALKGARRAASRFTLAEAERLYRLFLQLTPQVDEVTVRARSELATNVFRLQGFGKEATRELHVALQELERLAPEESVRQPLEVLLQTQLATLAQEQGKPEEARLRIESALPLARQLGQTRNQTLLLGLWAILEREQGRPEHARELYQQALVLARERGDRMLEATQLGNLAVLCYEQGRLEETRQLQEEALLLVRAVGERRLESITLGNLAFFHYEGGRPEQARQLWSQAIEIQRAVGDRRSEGYSLSSLGLLHTDEGRIEEAIEVWNKAVAIHRDSGDRASENATLTRLAALERRRGRLESAERLARQAEDQLRQGHYASDLAQCVCGLGHLALAKNEDPSPFLSEAQALALEIGARPESSLGKAISRLQAAIEAAAAGKPLFQGERIEDVPIPLHQRLLQERPVQTASHPTPRISTKPR